MEIIDNFLKSDDFDQIKNTIMGNSFPWYHYDDIAFAHEEKKDKTFFLTNSIYKDDKPSFPTSLEMVWPILKTLGSMNDNYKLRSLVRVKLNSYPNQNKFIEHQPHVDYDEPHQAAIYYINSNNGYTKLDDGTKVDSVANRLLLFDGSKQHSSTNCTNDKIRVNINFNYIKI